MEEMNEVKTAQTDAHRAEEIGDLLFVLVNWARWLGIEPETALRQANTKFSRRFRYVESKLDQPMNNYTLMQLDAFWNEAKAKGL